MMMFTTRLLLSISTLIFLGSQCRLIESVSTSDDSNNDSNASYHKRRLGATNSICQLCYHSIFKVNSCRLGSSKNEDMFGTYMIPKQTDPCYEDTCCASSMSECCSPSSSDSTHDESIDNTKNNDSYLSIDKGSAVNEENSDNNSVLSTETSCDVCDKAIYHVDQCRTGTAMDPNKYGTFMIIKKDKSSSECYEYTCCAWNMHDCCISSSYDSEVENAKWSTGIIVAFILAVVCMIIFTIIMIRIRPFRLYCHSDQKEDNNNISNSSNEDNKNSKLFVVEDETEIQHDNSENSTDDHTSQEDDHERNEIKENMDNRV